jgi:hypothetical protein
MVAEVNIPLEIGIGIVVAVISYVFGLLTRRVFWRKIIKGMKWLFNEIITVNLLAVREYPHIELKEIDLSLFDDLKGKIRDINLVQRYDSLYTTAIRKSDNRNK